MKILKLLETLNMVTSIIIAVLAVYIMIYPYFPEIVFAMNPKKFEGYAYQSEKTIEKLGAKANELPQIPIDNRLVIPKVYVNAAITEGEDLSALDNGMWRRPNTSTPDQGGNTVIAGHRVLYKNGPSTFYHLEKVAINDVILVYWKGKEFNYKIFEITEVDPHQVEVEHNTKDSILTLYTCTPRWTSEKRLVVKAKLQ